MNGEIFRANAQAFGPCSSPSDLGWHSRLRTCILLVNSQAHFLLCYMPMSQHMSW
jgi:hypothetical protein